MADEILGQYQHIIERFDIIMGTKGAFEFKVNGDLIYSKQTMQKRHAEPGEILQLFKEIVAPNIPIYGQ
ncbi:MAG: hypothetical protein GY803_28395 [Chloroflexi bacterium]|nr:hypothetical protein [Chloroflexota bacterium]